MSATLVLGASPEPSRYANLAIRRLIAAGHQVIAVGKQSGAVAGVEILRDLPANAEVDTVTLYLAPANLRMWQERILAMHPRRVIFNPGAEDPDFARRLEAEGIEVLDACTLVMLTTGSY